jgi:hypothetical protein
MAWPSTDCMNVIDSDPWLRSATTARADQHGFICQRQLQTFGSLNGDGLSVKCHYPPPQKVLISTPLKGSWLHARADELQQPSQ